jgi:hypothetical protein
MDGSQNKTAVDTAICNMVSDFGLSSTTTTLPPIDVLWVFATNSTANANLNWLGSSYTLTQSGTVTFSAAGGGTGGYYTTAGAGTMATGWNPSTAGGNYALNSASFGVCQFNSRTSTANYVPLGGADGPFGGGGHLTYWQPQLTSAANYWEINGPGNETLAATNAQGNWMAVRTGASATAVYKNGVSQTLNTTQTSTAVPNIAFYVVGYNNQGTAGYTQDQIGYAMFGGALSSAQASSVYTRLHNYFSAVGAPTGC